MPIFTFVCPHGHEFDKLTTRNTTQVPSDGHCGCTATAVKKNIYPVHFSGFTSTPLDQRTYWTEFRDYKEASAELQYSHSRAEEAAGGSLPTPPLAKMAARRAQKLLKLGVKDSLDLASREKH